MGLILGVDICDDYSQISAYIPERNDVEEITLPGQKKAERIPTVICKKKGEDEWLIGEEAYRLALFGGGIVVDRLVKLIIKKGTATIEGVKYNSEQLIIRYISRLLGIAREKYGEETIDSLVFTVADPEPRLNDVLLRAAIHCKVPKNRIHIYCHTECYAYYVMAQNPEIWNSQVSLFDLRTDGLFYYELKVVRGRKPLVVLANRQKLQEGFSLDILDSPSGEKLGDNILVACAERILAGKIVSSVLLTGKGFATTDWAGSFIKCICNRRRVYQTNQIFADGAAFAAGDLLRENTAFPYLMICEGRLASTISLYAVYSGRKEMIVLARAGSNWYEAGSSASFILDDVDHLELGLSSAVGNHLSKLSVSLDELPERPNKTTRIDLILSFTSENQLTVRVIDRGFGELFPATDKVIKQDFIIG